MKCAQQLKNTELSVLLIEKNKIIGPKVCAGGLTGLSAGFDLPESKMRSFNELMFYIDRERYKVKLIFPLKTIDRYDLGQHLLSKIKQAENITILKETIATQIKKDKIITNKGEFYYNYLVGADGSNSLVRRFLGLKSDVSIGLCCKVPQVTKDLIFYFNPKLLKWGYVWVFPHKHYTNIGVYFDPKHLSSKKAKEVLEDFLKKNRFVYSEKNFEAAILNFLYNGCVFKNTFLIGDAAGLVSKITGEGISPAMISGKEIGKKILKPNYRMQELARVLRVKERQERFEKIADMTPLSSRYFLKIFVNLIKTKWFQSYFSG